MEVHATLNDTAGLPQIIHNHGVLSPPQYRQLLASAKVSTAS